MEWTAECFFGVDTIEPPHNYYQVCFGLIKCVIECQSPRMRQKSFERFGKFLKLFDQPARLMLIRMIFR